MNSMIIIGAGGLAIEILEILKQNSHYSKIYFFDNINRLEKKLLFDKYRILTSYDEVLQIYEQEKSFDFCIGFGGIQNKSNLVKKFEKLGGKLTSIISDNSFVGTHNVKISPGVIIMPGVKISNNVKIGKASLIYYNSVITHDCTIGDFCELAPNVNILGNVNVGNRVWCGSNSVLFPNIKIGDNVVVGAMALVNKNVKDNATVIGIPAKCI